MVTSTFAHPYITQVISLWLSFVPIAAIGALMVAALVRGDRGRARIERVRVPGAGP
jgi:branched-subunit amino acid transport protein